MGAAHAWARRGLVVAVAAALVVASALVASSTRRPDGGGPNRYEATASGALTDPRVLVFSATAAYRHDSIGHAGDVLADLGAQHGLGVDHTEDPVAFTPANLARYAAVVWLSTTGDVLDHAQQDAFEAYIGAGGGYVGIHAAADTEYDWPWYGRLVGAWFDRHPPGVVPATIHVEDDTHPSTAALPARWTRSDEWYDFRTNPRAVAHVLATLDEGTYAGGGMGADHPIVWCRYVEGGRSWYTAGGHHSSAFDEPAFRAHLLGGLLWAAGRTAEGCGPTPPPPPPAPTSTTVAPPGAGAQGEPATARFVPTTPHRVLDTRLGAGAPAAPVASDGTITLVVAGRAGVPGDAVAVALTVTATEATGAGYVSAWPSGSDRPTTSVLNVEHPDQTIAGLVVVPLGAGGAVALYAQTATHLVADVAGWWVPSGATAAGRLVAVDPARLLDTREGLGAPRARLGDGGELALEVAGRGGLPGTGVAAVVLNVTATGAGGPGYLTVWPGGDRPLASHLNVARAGQTIANAVVVPVGDDGRVHLYAQRATDVVVDVTAWLTGPDAPVSGGGLLVPTPPARLLDTRAAAGAPAPLAGGVVTTLPVRGAGPVPASGVQAVVATVTATASTAAGFVTVAPAGEPLPLASSLNVERPGQTIANLAVVRLGPGGLALYAQATLDLVVDVSGWFTGPP